MEVFFEVFLEDLFLSGSGGRLASYLASLLASFLAFSLCLSAARDLLASLASASLRPSLVYP